MPLLSFDHQSSSPADSPPGSILYVGEPRQRKVDVSIYRYHETDLEEIKQAQQSDWSQSISEESVSWINLDGIHDLDLVKQLGEYFELHPLVLEDIVDTTQRPKIEEYDNGLFVVLKVISYQEVGKKLETEQLSLFLGKEYVLTFQEKTEDVFDPIRKRLLQNKGRVRKQKADYLFYALMDLIIGNYFLVLEEIEDQINVLEDRIHDNVSIELIKEIQQLKKALIFLNKSVYPLREVINYLERRQEAAFIQQKTLIFFRDLQDQLFNIIELIETFRDVLSNMHDLHLALNGHRMNQVMKVLTVVSSIFIPLTFIAGIYGMNFQHMPELAWKNGYFFAWGLMAIIAVILLLIFRKKSWL